MRTQYELQKKERSSLLANMSLEQHAFSYNQKNQLKSTQELPSASGNIRDKIDTLRDTASQSKYPSTPSKSLRMTQQELVEPSKKKETPEGTNYESQDTESCYQTTVQDSKRSKRKWFSLALF